MTETVCFSLFVKKVKNTFFSKKTGFAEITLGYSTLQPPIFCSKRVILGVFGSPLENPDMAAYGGCNLKTDKNRSRGSPKVAKKRCFSGTHLGVKTVKYWTLFMKKGKKNGLKTGSKNVVGSEKQGKH